MYRGYLNTAHLPTTEALEILVEEALFKNKTGLKREVMAPNSNSRFIKSANLTSFFNNEVKPRYDYAKYLAGHKYVVAKEGIKLGLPTGQMLAHDWSKFTPGMYGPYAKYFFGSPAKQNHDEWRVQVDKHFNLEKHHLDKIGLDKPIKYELESVMDWYSVYKNTGGTLEFEIWWNAHKMNFVATGKITQEVENQIDSRLQSDRYTFLNKYI